MLDITIDESRLRGHEEKGRFSSQCEYHVAVPDMVASNCPSAGEGIEQDRIHGLALHWPSMEKEV